MTFKLIHNRKDDDSYLHSYRLDCWEIVDETGKVVLTFSGKSEYSKERVYEEGAQFLELKGNELYITYYDGRKEIKTL